METGCLPVRLEDMLGLARALGVRVTDLFDDTGDGDN